NRRRSQRKPWYHRVRCLLPVGHTDRPMDRSPTKSRGRNRIPSKLALEHGARRPGRARGEAASGSRLVQQTRETVPAKSATSPEIRAKIARKRKLGDRTGTEVPRDTQETPRNVR